MEDADRALARPRPPRLRGDGALRADQLARAARARRAAVPRRPGALHADARRREPRRGAVGARAVSRKRAATSTSTPRSACSHARSVFAHGIWLDDADRAALARGRRADRPLAVVEPVPRQRPVRLARCRAAAGIHVSLASDVGGGTSLSMLRNMADAYKIQALAGERLTAWTGAARGDRAARRTRSASTTRSASLDAGRRRPTSASGTRRSARWRRAAPPWRAPCMSASSPG